MFEVTVEHKFPAAHALRNYKGKLEPIHGHNWRTELTLRGPELDECGLLADFIEVKRSLDRIIGLVDHTFLNEVTPFDVINPSAEHVARWIAEEFAKDMKAISPSGTVQVAAVRVWETDYCSATYFPK